MKNKTAQTFDSVEARLRQSVPPLAACRAARVEKVCAAAEALPPPRRVNRIFHRAALRMAAAGFLAAATVALLRFAPAPPAGSGPSLPPIPFLGELEALPGPQRMADALHAESDNLIGDFVTLTTVLNERSLAILF
jgi:hypothetical protein